VRTFLKESRIIIMEWVDTLLPEAPILVFIKSFTSKSAALTFEKMLKRQNRRYLEWLIQSEQNEYAGVRLG
jgi:predicted GIY-YIG superfamily endonuclease